MTPQSPDHLTDTFPSSRHQEGLQEGHRERSELPLLEGALLNYWSCCSSHRLSRLCHSVRLSKNTMRTIIRQMTDTGVWGRSGKFGSTVGRKTASLWQCGDDVGGVSLKTAAILCTFHSHAPRMDKRRVAMAEGERGETSIAFKCFTRKRHHIRSTFSSLW